MNLQELDTLIQNLINNREDQELINFYIKKRELLIKKIWDNVEKNLKKA